MLTNNYIICGIIVLICICAIVFGLRILRETRKMDPNHEKREKQEGKKFVRNKLQ